MKVANAEILAGICGFHTSVRAEGDDDFAVRLVVNSDCEKVRGLAAELGTVSALDELGAGHEGAILSTGRRHLKGMLRGLCGAGRHLQGNAGGGWRGPAGRRCNRAIAGLVTRPIWISIRREHDGPERGGGIAGFFGGLLGIGGGNFIGLVLYGVAAKIIWGLVFV